MKLYALIDLNGPNIVALENFKTGQRLAAVSMSEDVVLDMFDLIKRNEPEKSKSMEVCQFIRTDD